MYVHSSTLRQKNARRLVLALVSIVAALTVAVILGTNPAQAEAKSYTMPKVTISADAATDGSLNVIEDRSFKLDGEFTAVWWTFTGLPADASLQINNVYLTYSNRSAEIITLDEASFNLSWRTSGGPGRDSYSFDSPKNTVYAFFDAADEIVDVKLDYTVVNGVTAYKDVGEVYWKYVSEGWAEASENVTMTLRLPVPADTVVTPGDNVRGWGHGPLSGDLKVNDDGTITAQVNKVNGGQYAEVRAVFPRDWLTNLTDSSALTYANKVKLDEIMQEEQVWADEANRERMMSLAFVIGLIVFSVLLIIFAIWKFFQYGREYPTDFTDEYWRDAPSKEDHPLVMARLWRWNREDKNDLSAAIMYLSHLGAITMNKGSYEEKGRMVEDYYLVKVPAVADTLTSSIDKATMNLLFEDIAGGHNSLWFKTIEAYGKKNPETIIEKMKWWQGIITSEVNKRDFFEIKGEKWQTYIFVIAVLYAIAGIGLCFIIENFIPLVCVIPAAIALFVIANNMTRRSREGNNLNAKCMALKNWLTHFTALDERPPTDVKVWGEFMIYAYLFGVAKQVIDSLRVKVPEVFQDESASLGTSYIPWWMWYSAGAGHGGAVIPSPADMLNTSVSNTFRTAEAAISAASGDVSSGGGFGGGFSGGGGGGFGGGGGAR